MSLIAQYSTPSLTTRRSMLIALIDQSKSLPQALHLSAELEAIEQALAHRARQASDSCPTCGLDGVAMGGCWCDA